MLNRTGVIKELMSEWLKELGDADENMVKARESISSGGDGALAITDGQLFIKKPERGGRWPTIAPAQNNIVNIFYQGQQIESPLVLEDVVNVKFEVIQKEPESSFQIVISEDKMEVWLETRFTPGIEYQICNSDYVSDLIVSAREVRQLPAPFITPESVLQEAEKLGIKTELYVDKITNACYQRIDGRILIGVGIPPKLPVDSKIEFVYDLTEKKVSKEQGNKVDLFDRGKINSVEPGEVLAYWHPPVEGEPGIDVFGNIIELDEPKRTQLLAGSGVKLVGDGTIAVAEIAGRPCFDWGRLCVHPQLFIASDIDADTGNIEFTGDVVVTGDVKENLTIKAGGRVEVMGSVYHARIIAGGDVVIHKNLIGGHVSAGDEMANYMKIIASIKQIVPELKSLRRATLQLKKHPNFSVEDLKTRGDGYLIKLVLEMRFGEIPKLFKELKGWLPPQKDLEEDNEHSKLWNILHLVSRCYLGANPLNIKSISEVDIHLSCLQKIGAHLESILSTPANIAVDYCQNAQLEATGDIVVTGPLVYGCRMIAGSNIRITDSCRGGFYFATSSIKIGTAGINETVKTILATNEGGIIAARTFNPGVHISIGQGKMLINNVRRHVQFSFEHDKWVEK